MKLSIILPSYNVGEYIGDCLNSIYTQDLLEVDYEVICVNDCSTDGTPEIIRQYQSKHLNLFLINHEVNKNLGASRNTGLLYAKGKYVWFVDPDDNITENCLSIILSELENNELDILEINSNLTNPKENPLFLEANYNADSIVMNGYDYLKQLINTPYWGRKVEVWRRIFRKDFLDVNKFTFSESLFGVEDVIYFYKTMVLCKRFKHLAHYGYVYRNDRADSMTNSSKNKGLKLAVRIVVTLEVIEFFKNDILINDDEFKQKAIKTYKWSLSKFIRKIFLLDAENLNGYLTKINPYKPYIIKQLSWFKAILISNRLLVKGINAIFVPLKKAHNSIKKFK